MIFSVPNKLVPNYPTIYEPMFYPSAVPAYVRLLLISVEKWPYKILLNLLFQEISKLNDSIFKTYVFHFVYFIKP